MPDEIAEKRILGVSSGSVLNRNIVLVLMEGGVLCSVVVDMIFEEGSGYEWEYSELESLVCKCLEMFCCWN